MTLEESAPRKVLRPPTLEASHLLTGPTGCPGFEFSGLLRTIRRRARHCVSICRGFKYSVQIVESEHVVTDRASLLRTIRRRGRVRTSSAFVSAAHETRFHLPHVLDETPRHSSIRLQGMTLEESAPRKVLRPPTLEASHLLTGPTGCPGFEFSGLLRTIRRRARHCVSICRGFKYSVQIVKSEHVVTDRASLLRTIRRRADDPPPRTPPCHHLPRINAFRSNK